MIKKLSFLVRNVEKLNFCKRFQFFSYNSEEKETNNNMNNNNNNNNSQIGYNQKIILKNCNPYEFFSLVYDVGNYKNFLPWCDGSNIVQRQNFEYFEGELVVNFQIHSSGYVSEVYTSVNVDKQGNFEYEIKSVAKKGKTLKNLESIWKIKSYPNNRFVDCGINGQPNEIYIKNSQNLRNKQNSNQNYQAEINYCINFEFQKSIYQMITKQIFSKISSTMMSTFEDQYRNYQQNGYFKQNNNLVQIPQKYLDLQNKILKEKFEKQENIENQDNKLNKGALNENQNSQIFKQTINKQQNYSQNQNKILKDQKLQQQQKQQFQRINRDEYERHLQNGEIYDLLQKFEEKQLMKEIDIVKLEKLIQKKQNAKYLENGYKIYMKEDFKENKNNKNNNNKQNEVKFLHFIKNNFLHLS